MNELTKREQIALAMLEGKPDLIMCNNNLRINFLTNAFSFADLFLSISEDKAEETISEMDNLEARR